MIAASGPAPHWTTAPERGSTTAIRLMLWILRRLGRRAGQALLPPIAAYFLATSPRQRAAARDYLGRALGRPAGLRDLWRLYFAFASTILDGVFLAAGPAASQAAGYRIAVEGIGMLQGHIAAGRGCLLLGAHLGSFESLRALADATCPVEVSVMMHEANAAKAKALFDAIGGPRRAASIIPLGRPDSMLRVRERLAAGGMVGLLADRTPHGDRTIRVPFLGTPAALPVGPHVLAAMLGAPVVLAFGLWLGPRRYLVRFEPFAEPMSLPREGREAAVAALAARYAERLEAMCRAHPYNWFNFFDFWESGR